MTAPDFNDWQRPVASIESDAQLAQVAITGGPGTYTRTVDTSRYASLAVLLATDPNDTGCNYITLRWRDSVGNLLSADAITTWCGADRDGAVDQNTLIQVPVRGVTCDVVVNFGGAMNATVYVNGSTRQIFDKRTESGVGGQTHFPVNVSGRSINPGVTNTYRIGPYSGPFDLYMGTAIAAVTYKLTGWDFNNGLVRTLQLGQWTSTVNPTIITGLNFPGVAMELAITNGDTVARSPGLGIWKAY